MLRQKQQTVRARRLDFRPPLVELDAELEWVIQRALGPLTWQPKAPVSGPRLVDVALRLDLASRIAARHTRELLTREMGAPSASRLRDQYVATVAREALLDHALTQLLSHARAAGVSCILLKYSALSRLGVLRVGSRVASDIDVLVPHAAARGFQEYLKQHGFRDLGLPGSSHQLPALHDPNGILIELHLHVPVVSLGAAAPFVRADELLAAGLTVHSGDALLPVPAIVAAHAMAHGLLQHAYVPHVYSPLKAFADLADLELSIPGISAQADQYLSAVADEDLANIHALAHALSAGQLTTAMSGGPGTILRHALASQLNHRYAIRLRLCGLVRSKPTTVRRTPAQLVAALRAAWRWALSAPNSVR